LIGEGGIGFAGGDVGFAVLFDQIHEYIR
jgi:hypothetical protein